MYSKGIGFLIGFLYICFLLSRLVHICFAPLCNNVSCEEMQNVFELTITPSDHVYFYLSHKHTTKAALIFAYLSPRVHRGTGWYQIQNLYSFLFSLNYSIWTATHMYFYLRGDVDAHTRAQTHTINWWPLLRYPENRAFIFNPHVCSLFNYQYNSTHRETKIIVF